MMSNITYNERLAVARRYNKLYSDISIDTFLYRAALDELNYAYFKCACSPELDYINEFQKVINAYTSDNQIDVEILKYKDFLLRSGKPKSTLVGHYELNDFVSYIGKYYDGTLTSEYRKRGRFSIEPLCPEFI